MSIEVRFAEDSLRADRTRRTLPLHLRGAVEQHRRTATAGSAETIPGEVGPLRGTHLGGVEADYRLTRRRTHRRMDDSIVLHVEVACDVSGQHGLVGFGGAKVGLELEAPEVVRLEPPDTFHVPDRRKRHDRVNSRRRERSNDTADPSDLEQGRPYRVMRDVPVHRGVDCKTVDSFVVLQDSVEEPLGGVGRDTETAVTDTSNTSETAVDSSRGCRVVTTTVGHGSGCDEGGNESGCTGDHRVLRHGG